jgi:glucosamine-6-phosphate deaminase
MNVLRFDSESSWVQAICSVWRDRLHTKPDLKICLPSGTTPVEVYAEMSRSAAASLVSFEHATVFALDEFGGLSHGDPGRTSHTLRRQLIQHINLRPGSFHFLDPDPPDCEQVCRDYDVAIGTGFDLMVLGIGLNGHLGMNEPDSPLESVTRRVNLHDTTVQSSARYFEHENLPRWGLTVGLKTILASTEVWLLARGAAKASIIQHTVQGNITPSNPASLLRRHPNCWLFVDAGACALLNA